MSAPTTAAAEPLAHRRASRLLLLAALLAAVAGWRLFWFLTDDAYITFRYASNWLAGWGPTWNPPPFAPVEGYTSFLWLALLTGVWKLTGVEPPVAANLLSLACGLGILAVIHRLVGRMELPGVGPRGRLALLGLVLLGTVTNRTFLAWLSSGLETALFDLCLIWWVYEAVTRPAERRRGWGLRLSAAAALSALARPDGLLAVGATAVLLAWPFPGGGARWRARLIAGLPLLAVAAHTLWRRAYYGDWLPNTYYAKNAGAWPEAGWRYAASFAVENGAWALGLLALAAAIAGLRRNGLATLSPARLAGRSFGAVVAVGVVAAHALYYTVIIGGDHFEYRVYSHLVPLGFAAGAWLAARAAAGSADRPRALRPALGLALVVIASWPIQWVHWAATHRLTSRAETHVLAMPIHDRFPPPLRPTVAAWDDWQAWLIKRHVAMRHQEHKIFHYHQLAKLPRRMTGRELRWEEERVVATAMAVGVPGWLLPEVAILDLFGLNDRVIARNPDLREPRWMAHTRKPPEGYVACFRPNWRLEGGEAEPRRRRPLTDGEIRACEERRWY